MNLVRSAARHQKEQVFSKNGVNFYFDQEFDKVMQNLTDEERERSSAFPS